MDSQSGFLSGSKSLVLREGQVQDLPYYHGEFDPEGNLLDAQEFDADGVLVKGDPHLYWLLPTLVDNVQDPHSTVWAWVYRHAGDRNWVRRYGEREWKSAPGQ